MNCQPDDLAFLPPHEPTPICGFHAYARQLRIQPGQALEICVSGEGDFQAQIWKLGASTREGPLIAELPPTRAQLQTIARGSYVHVENGLTRFAALTVELWFRTLADVLEGVRAGLIAQSGAFEIALEKGNTPVVSVGQETSLVVARGAALSLKEWHHLAARWNGAQLDLWIDGQRVDAQKSSGSHHSTPVGPMRLGALVWFKYRW